MAHAQPGILAELPREARFLELDLAPGADAQAVRQVLAALKPGSDLVVGIGLSLVKALGAQVPGLRVHPHHVGPGFDVPSTPCALWVRVTGPDRGSIVHRSRRLLEELGPQVEVDRIVDAFKYGPGHDLSGYEDGTENPQDEAAAAAALSVDPTPGLTGSSFVAVQQWLHDMDAFESMPRKRQDHTIGRRHSDNEELPDAPPSAHVKRAAQESYEPAAFVLRRSMPWAEGEQMGLVFLAFGHSFDAYEAILNRMVGGEDGVSDALFTFTRPLSGAFYWCPPIRDGRLDLRLLGG